MMLKRMLCALTAAAMMGSLCACAGGASASQGAAGASGSAPAASREAVELKVWGGIPPESGFDKVCENFNREFRDQGIQVSYERYVNDDQGNMKLETNLLAGSEIDVYISHGGLSRVQKRAGGMALQLDALCARDGFDLDAELGGLRDSALVDGKLYAIPCVNALYGIVINKDMFDAAGIEIPTHWTLDEFRAVAKRLTHGQGADKVYGMFFNTQQDLTYPFQFFSSQTLGPNLYYNGDLSQTNFTAGDNVKSVQTVVDMMLADGSAPTHSDSVTQKLSQEGMFLAGKCAMTIGPWMVRSIKDTANYPHDFVTAFAPYPVPSEDAAETYAQGGAGDFMSINPKSDHIDAAWEFVKWYSRGGMLPLVGGGRVPLNATIEPQAVLDAFLEGGEGLLEPATTQAVLLTPRSHYAPEVVSDKHPEVLKILQQNLEAIYLGKVDAAQGLAAAKTEADKLLG